MRTIAVLDNARIPITIDVGFGDAVTPAATDIDFGSLLELESPNVRAYPPETVIAEKFHAMVALGMINGRMKDYYDLWAIPRSVAIDANVLAMAIRETFARRNTAVPTAPPPGLSQAFYESPDRLRQWQTYAASIDFNGVSLEAVVIAIWDLLGPVSLRASD